MYICQNSKEGVLNMQLTFVTGHFNNTYCDLEFENRNSRAKMENIFQTIYSVCVFQFSAVLIP